MQWIEAILKADFSDPINLLPLLMAASVIIFLLALFLDQPPE
jgi:hypothetical protein